MVYPFNGIVYSYKMKWGSSTCKYKAKKKKKAKCRTACIVCYLCFKHRKYVHMHAISQGWAGRRRLECCGGSGNSSYEGVVPAGYIWGMVRSSLNGEV